MESFSSIVEFEEEEKRRLVREERKMVKMAEKRVKLAEEGQAIVAELREQQENAKVLKKELRRKGKESRRGLKKMQM